MEITKIPDKILAKKTEKIGLKDIKNGSFRELVSDMKKSMKDNEGIGLAANQINKDLSIFVIDEKLAAENNVPDVFFNPEITEYSRDEDELEEGCLSIPGYGANIRRSKKIKIKSVDENGNKIKLKVRGFLARVLQHETDHLNGIVIKNRAGKQA
ncbi:MAG: peptide deformylase [Candidatus Yanofskybacteria bacterium RIFCSPLOWO2_02_FULL_43_10]|uniref:Peptide deformylase n=1 Tax=Candidatus Yanofskybacteria bacterium RIFCSPLOWO2_12_FULL_43_11b TaxID=1802710 RepID=A0A1F8H6M9_9BACT|nr:MAG: peptide deformylase [Candidatus Yanofskybacteria bacterium RIFCSPHIGHO2_01_FULL_43_32]OGN11980.1 MAG: peptide deformylase [Candidatus Yanofskybacteria bacterium RIFCSPHIGHO2_02_FULL_43_12]OGN24764.1 MAG: peptide deformylase [Candidatus Yanofskybacteria bacterium RIFCSPLOWO2_01_FULL_43_46]OGN30186.1 MAG: peptide deformylase [Candidatus Yanofskybacteria bacterium RIFCSPLOWO2_02_FULL_43_10]OGN33237.1 MAG: peptide deformylase [Candidatus Yanofskybacteria bacterium RIFCSPLOWO2_12_FULL_43_11b